MEYIYKTKGVCASQIKFDINKDVISNIQFIGGCNGNLQGISSLVKGMKCEDAISRLEGIKCGFKPTSCPDQLAQALKAISKL